ncbi:MAG: hypothetical protein ABR533_10400 [Desulfonatronovibrio sp.]
MKTGKNILQSKSIVDDLINSTNFEAFYDGYEDKNIMFSNEELIEAYRSRIFDMFEKAWNDMDE